MLLYLVLWVVIATLGVSIGRGLTRKPAASRKRPINLFLIDNSQIDERLERLLIEENAAQRRRIRRLARA
jgi:hypothetical protein